MLKIQLKHVKSVKTSHNAFLTHWECIERLKQFHSCFFNFRKNCITVNSFAPKQQGYGDPSFNTAWKDYQSVRSSMSSKRNREFFGGKLSLSRKRTNLLNGPFNSNGAYKERFPKSLISFCNLLTFWCSIALCILNYGLKRDFCYIPSSNDMLYALLECVPGYLKFWWLWDCGGGIMATRRRCHLWRGTLDSRMKSPFTSTS